MQSVASVALFLVAVTGVAGETVTPINKVVQLLKDMHAKGLKEKEAEEVRFAAFDNWCGNTARTRTQEIAEETEKIEALGAQIEQNDADIRGLTARIQELEEDVGRWEKDTKSATDVRNKENADYVATNQDFGESLTALEGAIEVMKKQAYDRPQAALIQKALSHVHMSRLVPMEAKKALVALLQEPGEAAAYEFQSGGVVQILEDLYDKFKKQKYDMDKEELANKHAFEQMVQQLTSNIQNAKAEIARKTTSSAQTGQAKAQATSEKKQEEQDKAADELYLKDTNALCGTKRSQFANRNALRDQELQALTKAIEIISGETVAGAGEKNLPKLLQARAVTGTSLAHLRSAAQSPVQERVSALLAERAQSLNSRPLELISQQISASPFEAVKKLIFNLINKLQEEATAETEQKGWCDGELAANKITREARTADVESLSSTIEDLNAELAQLAQDVAALQKAIKELDAEVAKATADREASNAANTQTIKEAKEAQAAVSRAIQVLQDFYAKSATATDFIQQTQPAADAPETFEGAYQGLMPEGGSVVDFLQVILTDFERLEAQTTSDEAAQKKDYDNLMFESKKDKALKNKTIEQKTSRSTDQKGALTQATADLKAAQTGLDDAKKYYDKLHPQCVDSGVTYEERVKRREAEMQSLQEALQILKGQSIDLD